MDLSFNRILLCIIFPMHSDSFIPHTLGLIGVEAASNDIAATPDPHGNFDLWGVELIITALGLSD